MHKSDVFLMSLGAIGSNKLRSFLTLVGIVLGVASIIGVMTAITIMQDTMEKEMSVLGAQTFQVQKWPNGFNSDEQRRAAQKWPDRLRTRPFCKTWCFRRIAVSGSWGRWSCPPRIGSTG